MFHALNLKINSLACIVSSAFSSGLLSFPCISKLYNDIVIYTISVFLIIFSSQKQILVQVVLVVHLLVSAFLHYTIIFN